MSKYVTDTHPILWHILNDARLSETAKAIFTDADAGLHQIFVPSIVLVESVYLVEKKRINSIAIDRLFALLDLAPANYAVAPLDFKAYGAYTLRWNALSETLAPDEACAKIKAEVEAFLYSD